MNRRIRTMASRPPCSCPPPWSPKRARPPRRTDRRRSTCPPGSPAKGVATGAATRSTPARGSTGASPVATPRRDERGVRRRAARAAATGLKADLRHGLLWVAGAATGQAAVYDLGPATRSRADLDDRAVVHQRRRRDARCRLLHEQPVAGDLPGARLAAGEVGPPETIALSGPGRRVVAGVQPQRDRGDQRRPHADRRQQHQGQLYTVDARTGASAAIDLGGATVPTGDGILLVGRELLVLQNGGADRRTTRSPSCGWRPGWRSGEVVDTITSPLFETATTLARSGTRWSPSTPSSCRRRSIPRPRWSCLRAFGYSARWRREEMTPVSKPARCRPPAKRACSIFRQRSITTLRPLAWTMSRGLVRTQPELGPERRDAGDGDDLGGDRREVLGTAEHVDEVGRCRQVGQRRVDRAAEDRPALRVDEPHVVEVAARRQQVRGDEVARPAGIGRHADDGDRARGAQDRQLARGRSAATTRPRCVSARPSPSPLPAPGRGPTRCRRRPRCRPRGGPGRPARRRRRARSSDSWRWVVLAGWMTSVRASPMLARWLHSSTDSTKRRPASRPPCTPNENTAPGPTRQVALRPIVVGVVGQAGPADPRHRRVLGEELRPPGGRWRDGRPSAAGASPRPAAGGRR